MIRHALAGTLAVAVLLLTTPYPSALPQDVLVVDVMGGAPFQQIQQAVNAAQEGDVVLVKSGAYQPVSILGLSLIHISEPTRPY